MPVQPPRTATVGHAASGSDPGPARRAGRAPRRHVRASWLLFVVLGALVVPACVPVEPIDGYTRPIVISSGGTYVGRWASLDSRIPAVLIRTSEPVIIEDSAIRGRGDLIRTQFGRYANVTVRNVIGEGLPPLRAGRSPGRFLSADTYAYVSVENSTMVGTSGIYLHRSVEGATVRIVGNRALNIDGRKADGLGGTSGFDRVQFVQFNAGHELRDTVVAWNEVVNEPYRSRVEDVISVYATTGRPDDPVRIHDNLIFGAYAADPSRDPYSGGGIMLGDAGGAHVHAYRNQVVSTSNYGIAVSGGSDQQVYDNRVISCGRLPDGTPIAAQNVGIYIWNFARDEAFARNTGSGNTIAWAHPTLGRNDAWVPDAASWSEATLVIAQTGVPCEEESAEYARWLRKVADAGVTIGVHEAAAPRQP